MKRKQYIKLQKKKRKIMSIIKRMNSSTNITLVTTKARFIYLPTCKAWISKVTILVGPPLEIGIFDKILASVKAVATSPSSSIRSDVPVGKNGRTSVKDETNSFGSAYITDNCSKITPGELNEARKATCWPRIPWALDMNKLGNPSSNFLID